LRALYANNVEFVVWEVLKGESAIKRLRKGEKTTSLDDNVNAKKKRDEKKKTQMSVAQTGILSKKGPAKKQAPEESIEQKMFNQKVFNWLGDKQNQKYSSFTFHDYSDSFKVRDESGFSVSLDNPKPHHFNHPEKYLDDEQRLILPCRSWSSLSDPAISQSRTPPSPHHYENPLATIAPNGKAPPARPKKDIKEANKEKPLIKNRLKKGTRDNFDNIDRPISARSNDERKIMFDGVSSGMKNRHWNEQSPDILQRKANDQTIDVSTTRLPHEKTRGDFVHVPIGKFTMDVGTLFVGSTDASFTVGHLVGIEKCVFLVNLDSLLLSHVQKRLYIHLTQLKSNGNLL
jgi:hypothetical protein